MDYELITNGANDGAVGVAIIWLTLYAAIVAAVIVEPTLPNELHVAGLF